MAIAPGTSPGIEASFSNPITSDSFDAPAGSTLVACVTDTDVLGSSHIFTVSNSGTALSWTLGHRSSEVAIYTAFNANAQTGITVSFATDGSPSDALVLKVLVWSGVSSDTPIGAFASGTSTTNFIEPYLYTSTENNTRGVYIANDSNGTGTPASGGPDTQTSWSFSSGSGASSSGIVSYKPSNTATSGTDVFGYIDGFGTAATSWTWVAVELLPSTTQTITLTGISSGEAFGTTQLNQTITASGIASAETIGDLEVVLQDLVIVEGIASAEAVGTPFLVFSQPVIPSAIASSETFGTPVVQLGYPQTVTAEGIASEEAVTDEPLIILHHRIVFRPPSIQEQPAARNVLLVRFGIHRGITVVRRQDLTFYETRFPDQVTVEEANRVYWGGHVNEITSEEFLALTAAGYGSYLSVEALT